MKPFIARLVGIGIAFALLAGGCSVCVQTGGTPQAWTPQAYADDPTPTPTPTPGPNCSSPGCGGGG